MAHHKSAKKRIKTDKIRNLRNREYKSRMRTMIKRVRSCSDSALGNEMLRKTVSLLDKLVTKGIIHINTASRHKSRLTKFVNSL